MFAPPSKIERIEILPKLELGEYFLKHQRIDGGFGSLEETYFAVSALSYIRMIESIDRDALLKYILDCKRVNGFAANPHESEIDLHSLFYAINILFLIRKQKVLSMDEFESMYNNIFNFQKKNGGFSHCNLDFCPICKGKATLKSTYFAILVLKLLYDIKSPDEKRILAYLSKNKSKNDVQQTFRLLSLLLLDHIEDVEETSITNLINLQQTNGGFGSIEYSFWVLYCLDTLKRLRNINKGKVFEYIRSHRKEDGSFFDEKQDPSDQFNISTTAWSTITLTILWNELIEYIEQKILIEIYSNERVLIENIAEECFVRFDLVVYIIKQLMRYDWFKVKIRDTVDIFKDYIKKFDAVSRRIAVYILKYIVNQNVVNLSELAKSFSATDYSKALQRVIAVSTKLIEEKFIIGEIKWNKRFFRVTAFLNGVLPGKALVRASQIPYHEVTVEKGQIPIEQRRIQETIDRIKPITDRIRSEIDNLLDLSEVELAKTHLKKDITEALRILNSSNQNIEMNVSKFQYLNGEYTHFLMRDWVSIYHKTKETLLEIEKEYLKKIEKKEEVVQILKDLESFQNYVQNQLNTITEELNTTQKLFQKVCEENALELKKVEIKRNLDNISISVERITPQLREQAANLYRASSRLRLSQDSSQLNALQPLEKWLESMWMKKRKNTIKVIKDLKGQLNAREELQENIKNRRELFEFKLRELSKLIDSIIESNQFMTANTTLHKRTEAILNYLSESNQYVLNYIQDTASYLEGFQLTIDDLYQEWSKTTLENMRNELISAKSDLEKKILSKRELDKNDQLINLIEKNILELKQAAESMERNLFDFIEHQKLSGIVKEIKRNRAEIDELMKYLNLDVNAFIKKTAQQEFPNFPETSQVTLHKWKLFKESYKRNLSLISDKIKNETIIKLLFAVAPIFRGGRVKLDYLTSKLNLKKDEIEDRTVYLISVGKLEAQFDKETNEIIPLTSELKAILKFERIIQAEMESLKKEYERTRRLFETSCRKRQLDDKVIDEIIDRTRGVLSKKYETEVAVEKKIKELPRHIDLDLLLEKWSKQKVDVEQNLALIKSKITQRMKFKEKIAQYVKKIKSQMNEISSPIEMKIDFGEILEASKLLSKNINLVEQQIKKTDQDLKIHIKKISNDLDRFDLVVVDLLNYWIHEKTKLKTNLSDLNARLKEKINETLNNQYKKELEEMIHNCNIILNNFLNDYEKDVEILIHKGELLASLSNLHNFHKKFIKIDKNCQYQIKRFIITKSKSLKNFKDTVNSLVTRWELQRQEHQKSFQENYLQLENQLIIKYLQIQQTVFTTRKLSMAELSKKLHIKKNELRQRFISLITAEKLSGKIDPNTDEFIFPSSRIQDAELERPPIAIRPETPSTPLKHRIYDKFADLIRKWYPIIGSVGSVGSITVITYSTTGNLILALLIPAIVFPTLFLYVLINHYKQKDQET